MADKPKKERNCPFLNQECQKENCALYNDAQQQCALSQDKS